MQPYLRLTNSSLLRLAIFIFVISVAVALTFQLVLPDSFRTEEFTDYVNFYEPTARNIAAGKGIVDAKGQPATFQGPRFPILLAGIFTFSRLTGVSESALIDIVIFLCNGFTSVLIFLTARSLCSARWALLIALIWVVYPFNLWFVQNLSSENPFMVLLYASTFLIWRGIQRERARYFVIAGGLIGLTALVRPIALWFSIVVALSLLFVFPRLPRSNRIRYSSSVVAMTLLVILPWIGWLYFQIGKIIPIASSSFGTVVEGLTFGTESYFPSNTLPTNVLSLQYRIDEADPEEVGELISVLLTELQREPLSVLHLFAMKAARSWYGTYSGNNERIALILQIPFLLVCLLGLGRLILNRTRTAMVSFHVLIILYFWLMSTAVNANLRYMSPIMGIAFMFIPGVVLQQQDEPLKVSEA